MADAAPPRLSLRKCWHRLRTSPRFPFVLFFGLLVAGGLSQVYCFWWDVRIERMLIRNRGMAERIPIYPRWVKNYLGWQFVSRFEPIQCIHLYFDEPEKVERHPGDLRLLRGALFLREIWFYGKLTDDDVKHVRCLTQLRSVRSWYYPKSALDAVEQLPNLTSLEFNLGDTPEPEFFRRLASMPQLQRLRLHLGEHWVGGWGRGPKTIVGLRELAKSQTLPRLETNLENDEFLALTSLQPDGSPPLPALNELRIPGSRGVTPQSLDNLKNLPSLIHLELSWSLLTDEHLPHLKQLPHLRTLYVDSNPRVDNVGVKITDKGLGITDEGAKVLASMHNLQSLNVKRTNITQAGLLRLATLPRLRSLRAHPTGSEAAAELRQRLPAGCELDMR